MARLYINGIKPTPIIISRDIQSLPSSWTPHFSLLHYSSLSSAFLITLICITHHSRLLSDQGPTPQILGYKADGCCWSRERQAAYSRSFPKMWEGGVEVHSYYRSLGRWLYNWLIYIITFTFIASRNISIDILMFLTLESMFQLIHTNVWKKIPQEYFVPINSFHILSLLL